jgi:spermidine export protein MdtJ
MLLRPWLYLFAAIAAEVIGVTVMKLVSSSGSLAALFFMYAMIGLSFYFLATTMKHLPIALAYATWETVGLICVAFIGFRYFGEDLSLFKLLGMAVLILGVILVNIGVPKISKA